MFPKLKRDELEKEEQRLEQTVKRHLLLAFPLNLCVAGTVFFVANRYFGYKFGVEEFILLMFVANITLASDLLQLRSVRKKL